MPRFDRCLVVVHKKITIHHFAKRRVNELCLSHMVLGHLDTWTIGTFLWCPLHCTLRLSKDSYWMSNRSKRTEIITVKVKISLCFTKHHAMRTYWESRGMSPVILDLGTRWRWVVSVTHSFWGNFKWKTHIRCIGYVIYPLLRANILEPASIVSSYLIHKVLPEK